MAAMYGFHAGLLKDRIRIRRKTTTKNEAGGLDSGWETIVDDLPAQVASMNGREALIGNVLQGISTFEVTIRFRADLKASDQIIWFQDGNRRELNIVNAEDAEGKRRWTVIQASTQAPQGA
jgi:head-tail adaptor